MRDAGVLAEVGAHAAVLLSLGVAANLLALQGAGERARSGKLRRARGRGPCPRRAEPGTARRERTGADRRARASARGQTRRRRRARRRGRSAPSSASFWARGYEAGAADMPRLVTRRDHDYEHDNGLPLSGAADEALLKAVVLGGAHAGARPPAVAAPGPHAAQVTRTVQQWLAGLGYSPGPADGRFPGRRPRAPSAPSRSTRGCRRRAAVRSWRLRRGRSGRLASGR